MGGTMPYDRLRYRNGLNDRRMEGDPYDVPGYRMPGGNTGPILDPDRHTIRTDYLQGEMNRMEQSYMGVYYPGSEYLRESGARATGLTVEQVLSVLRWVFGLPEPYCLDCARQSTLSPISQRCPKHRGDPPAHPVELREDNE